LTVLQIRRIIFKQEYLKWRWSAGFSEPLGEETMITRRHLLGTAGAGAAFAVSGLRFSNAETAAAILTPGIPEGVATYATMATLPGKKPLIELLRSKN
jgi:hypothetical protein